MGAFYLPWVVLLWHRPWHQSEQSIWRDLDQWEWSTLTWCEVSPGSVLRDDVREASCELDEEVEPSNIVHIIVLSLLSCLHSGAQQASRLARGLVVTWHHISLYHRCEGNVNSEHAQMLSMYVNNGLGQWEPSLDIHRPMRVDHAG